MPEGNLYIHQKIYDTYRPNISPGTIDEWMFDCYKYHSGHFSEWWHAVVNCMTEQCSIYSKLSLFR